MTNFSKSDRSLYPNYGDVWYKDNKPFCVILDWTDKNMIICTERQSRSPYWVLDNTTPVLRKIFVDVVSQDNFTVQPSEGYNAAEKYHAHYRKHPTPTRNDDLLLDEPEEVMPAPAAPRRRPPPVRAPANVLRGAAGNWDLGQVQWVPVQAANPIPVQAPIEANRIINDIDADRILNELRGMQRRRR